MCRVELNNPHVNATDMTVSRFQRLPGQGEPHALKEQVRLSPGQRGAMDLEADEYVVAEFTE